MESPRIAPLTFAAAYQGYTTLLDDHLTVKLFRTVDTTIIPDVRIVIDMCLGTL